MEIYIPWFEPSTHLCLGVREITVFRRSSGARMLNYSFTFQRIVQGTIGYGETPKENHWGRSMAPATSNWHSRCAYRELICSGTVRTSASIRTTELNLPTQVILCHGF